MYRTYKNKIKSLGLILNIMGMLFVFSSCAFSQSPVQTPSTTPPATLSPTTYPDPLSSPEAMDVLKSAFGRDAFLLGIGLNPENFDFGANTDITFVDNPDNFSQEEQALTGDNSPLSQVSKYSGSGIDISQATKLKTGDVIVKSKDGKWEMVYRPVIAEGNLKKYELSYIKTDSQNSQMVSYITTSLDGVRHIYSSEKITASGKTYYAVMTGTQELINEVMRFTQAGIKIYDEEKKLVLPFVQQWLWKVPLFSYTALANYPQLQNFNNLLNKYTQLLKVNSGVYLEFKYDKDSNCNEYYLKDNAGQYIYSSEKLSGNLTIRSTIPVLDFPVKNGVGEKVNLIIEISCNMESEGSRDTSSLPQELESVLASLYNAFGNKIPPLNLDILKKIYTQNKDNLSQIDTIFEIYATENKGNIVFSSVPLLRCDFTHKNSSTDGSTKEVKRYEAVLKGPNYFTYYYEPYKVDKDRLVSVYPLALDSNGVLMWKDNDLVVKGNFYFKMGLKIDRLGVGLLDLSAQRWIPIHTQK